MKGKCCAVIGSLPVFFPWGLDEEDERCDTLKAQLLEQIASAVINGVRDFAVVMDYGWGLYAAEMINDLMEGNGNIRLTCIIPWEEQAAKWTPELRERYFKVQEKCAEAVLISQQQTVDCEITAMLDAVDMADTVIAVYGEGDVLLPVALRYTNGLKKAAVVISSDSLPTL